MAATASTMLPLGTLAPEGSSWHKLLLELGERWSVASGGKVKLKVYGLVLTTSWKRDVSAEPAEDGVHRLLNRARIVQLP